MYQYSYHFPVKLTLITLIPNYLAPRSWCHYLHRLGIHEVWLGPSYLGLDHRPNDCQPQGLVGSSVLVWPGDNGSQGLNFHQLPAHCAHGLLVPPLGL